MDGLDKVKQTKQGDGLMRIADILGMVPDIPLLVYNFHTQPHEHVHVTYLPIKQLSKLQQGVKYLSTYFVRFYEKIKLLVMLECTCNGYRNTGLKKALGKAYIISLHMSNQEG